VLGTLTDPISLFLTPLFVMKWHADRRKENCVQAVIQLLCSTIQAGVILYSLLYDNSYARLQFHNWRVIVKGFFIDHFSLNLVMFNPDCKYRWLIVGILMAAYFIYVCVIRRTSREHFYFLAGFIIVALISTLGSLQAQGGPRYGYVPTCILMIILFAEACSLVRVRNYSRIIAMVIFTFALTVNGIYYKFRMMESYSPAYPKWKEEVAKWRTNRDYKPIIHPTGSYPWYVNL